MSNPEEDPSESVCAAGPARIEVLEPRDVPLGGLRAMNVRRTLPQRGRSLIGAWCFLDHYGPDDVAESGGMNVPAHPHIGLQTVSWLFSGEIEHRDSAGFHAMVRPGELNLMTAGRGISHSERSTPETTTLHGAQLWIALPAEARDTPKTFAHYAPPVISGSGWTAQVFLGSLLGESSPVQTHTVLVGAEIVLEPQCELRVDVDPGSEHGVLVDSGSVAVSPGRAFLGANGEPGSSPVVLGVHSIVDQHELAYLPVGDSLLSITAGDEGARLLVIGGEPFGEELVMWWNFVGRDHEEILRARADWQAELSAAGVRDVAAEARDGAAEARDGAAEARDPAAEARDRAAEARDGAGYGVGVPEGSRERFGLPTDEPDPPLSAPPAPIAKLLPRRR